MPFVIDINPVALDLAGIDIRWYGLVLVAAHGGRGGGHEAHDVEEPDDTGPDTRAATAVDRPHGGCH